MKEIEKANDPYHKVLISIQPTNRGCLGAAKATERMALQCCEARRFYITKNGEAILYAVLA